MNSYQGEKSDTPDTPKYEWRVAGVQWRNQDFETDGQNFY